jgi:hypothetical protein
LAAGILANITSQFLTIYFQTMIFKPNHQILKGEQPYGRFGSAIANLGDINSDSFSGPFKIHLLSFLIKVIVNHIVKGTTIE